MVSRHIMILAALALLSTPGAASAARSMDWIADRDIGTYCEQFLVRPNSPSGTVCLSYIQGFLDGLRTTEKPLRAALEVDHSDAQDAERAHVSAMRMDALVAEFGPPARAGICLPENFSGEEITRVIARELRHGRSYTRGALDDYAQAALQERYPCDTSDPMQEEAEVDADTNEDIEGQAQ